MSQALTKSGRAVAKKIITLQLATSILCTIVALLVSDTHNAISAFLGGLLSIIPQLFFSLIALGISGATKARLIVRMFQRGEAIKIVLTIVLFFVVTRWPSLNSSALLTTFVLCQLMHFGTAFKFNFKGNT